jgi:hypothetical protein
MESKETVLREHTTQSSLLIFVCRGTRHPIEEVTEKLSYTRDTPQVAFLHVRSTCPLPSILPRSLKWALNCCAPRTVAFDWLLTSEYRVWLTGNGYIIVGMAGGSSLMVCVSFLRFCPLTGADPGIEGGG